MGCAASSPANENAQHGTDNHIKVAAQTKGDVKNEEGVEVEDQPKGEPAAGEDGDGDVNKEVQKKTRARRLSYVTADAKGNVIGGQPTPGKPATPPSAPEAPRAPGASAKARARRLSYISNDPNAGPTVQPPGAVEGEDDMYEDNPDGPAAAPSQVVNGDGGAIGLTAACMSKAGREPGFKKTNQDNCFAYEKYISEDQSLFGAMDGHGPNGHLVSSFVKAQLPIILVNHLTSEGDPKDALTSGFLEVDQGLKMSRVDCEFSGSTCVVSYLNGTTLTTAWVGDSRGVLAREHPEGNKAIDLTIDHKPTDPEEKNRILRSNGRVERLVDEDGEPMGPYRVWMQYAWVPGLAMSRALGDALAHQVGVTSEPQHSVHEITTNDRFFILASDGIWEFITSQEAVDIVSQFDSPEDGCRSLIEEAHRRWMTEEEGVVDDITAVIVKFLHP